MASSRSLARTLSSAQSLVNTLDPESGDDEDDLVRVGSAPEEGASP